MHHSSNHRHVLVFAITILILCITTPLCTSLQTRDQVIPWDEAIINDEILMQIIENRVCFAMNANDTIFNGHESFLEIKYVPPSVGNVSLTTYNLLDQHRLGRKLPPPHMFAFQCTEELVDAKQCNLVGELLFQNETEPFHAKPMSMVIDLNAVTLPYIIKYDISVTGLYCLVELPLATFFQEVIASTDLRYVNAHGLLPAIDYPKLPFYGFTSLIYLAVLLLWIGKSVLHWNEILQVQKYISGVIAFVTFETALNYFYFLDWNTRGDQSWPLLLTCAILNSIRNSSSLFILLIVALGYGVVKPSLGDDMRKCQLLAVVHGVLGAIYAGITLKQSEHKSAVILLIVIPLAVTLTIFYVWTLTALTTTTHHLQARRQHYKLKMYTALWRLLFFAGINLAIYFITNTVWFAQRNNLAFISRWWSWRWFVVDGWLNLLYSVCMLAIAAQWRPTSGNARYGLEELVSDPLEDEFDLDDAGSIGGYPGILGGGGNLFDDAPESQYSSHHNSPTASYAHKKIPASEAEQANGEVIFVLDNDSDTEQPATNQRPDTLRSRSASPRRNTSAPTDQ